MKLLGQRLKGWREQVRRKLKWSAGRAGVSVRTLQLWEAGERVPRLDQFVELTLAYEVTTAEYNDAIRGVRNALQEARRKASDGAQ